MSAYSDGIKIVTINLFYLAVSDLLLKYIFLVKILMKIT